MASIQTITHYLSLSVSLSPSLNSKISQSQNTKKHLAYGHIVRNGFGRHHLARLTANDAAPAVD